MRIIKKYFIGLIISLSFMSCSKDKVEEQKKVINKYIVVEAYTPSSTFPYTIDLNQDGLPDVEFTGGASISGSSGAKSELYIQGLNGTSICFQTNQDTSWIIDVFTGTYDTLISYNTFKQPSLLNLGDEINNQLNYSESLLTVFHKHNKGSMSIPSSNIDRTNLVTDNFNFFAVKTTTGMYWIKIKVGIPTTIIESHSNKHFVTVLVIE